MPAAGERSPASREGPNAETETKHQRTCYVPARFRTYHGARNGFRSRRSGERRPPPPDVPPRGARLRGSGSRSARVRARAGPGRPRLVADAAGGPGRVRQFALQRAVGFRRRPSADQRRSSRRGRAASAGGPRRRTAIACRARRLRGGADGARRAPARGVRGIRAADRGSCGVRALLRRQRGLAGGLRALQRHQERQPRSPLDRLGPGAARARSGRARPRLAQPARRHPPAPIRAVRLRPPVAGAARRVPPARHRADRRSADLRRPRQRRRLGAPRPLPPRRRRASRRVVAGVPPDYFSDDRAALGQPALPLGRASADEATAGGSTRFAPTLARFDAVRLDHFIGFVALLGSSRRRSRRR